MASNYDTVIIGSGIVGISTAFYLKKARPDMRIALVDQGQPMALTSAQSGENYRNWWPHPVMTAFTDRSIDLMEELASESGDRFRMSRRGYALATRTSDVDAFLAELDAGYADMSESQVRIHDRHSALAYRPADTADWRTAPGGVDVLTDRTSIRQAFPSFDTDIRTVFHVRRAGAIDAQQMGQLMLERFRSAGGDRVTGEVTAIEQRDGFRVQVDSCTKPLRADCLVNAAGPFVNTVAGMLGIELPVRNVLQQKIAFEDTAAAIPRRMPFSIDLDPQRLDWDDEERDLLAADPEQARWTEEMPGAVHCRPDGGDDGRWVKIGWAFNESAEMASREPVLSEAFPDIVLRGAARLNPALKRYDGQLPHNHVHYGGYYTLTDENWPLIGPMSVADTFVVGALSGFGTMAACAAGELCARWITGNELPAHAFALSPKRYDDATLMTRIRATSSRGIL